MFEPVVKWSGSKRSQAEEIIKRIPKKVGTYYEPFCGGCSVLWRLLASKEHEVGRFVCSDANSDLINLWNAIKECPVFLASTYAQMWNELNQDDGLARKKAYFNMVRERFNATRQPQDFLFIMRTTTNGMPRYNKEGRFNNSFHVTRNGIEPNRFKKVIEEWSSTLVERKVGFVCQDYRKVNPEKGDFLYLDPPYAGTTGMYYGGIELNPLWDYLRNVKCGYALSFDGKIEGGNDFTYSVPEDIYTKHEYLKSGNSSFRRVVGKNNHAEILESLYVKEIGDV